MLKTSGLWVAYVRLEDPPGLSPITTVGRYATVEETQVAVDEAWASRETLTLLGRQRAPWPAHWYRARRSFRDG
jgi:hypothetical protein